MSLADILKATQLTRGGRLMDATRLIQKALGLAKSPSAPAGPADRAAADARADTRSGSRPAARDGARPGDDDVVDTPFREVLRKPANESVFSPHEVPEGPEGPEVQDTPDVAAPRGEPQVEPSEAKLAPASASRPASFTESTFRSGASTYAYRLYVPGSDGADVAPGAAPGASHATAHQAPLLPLIVLLHGCKQDAADFAAGTAMNALAETEKCLVLYPEQLSSANPMRCWNWFDAAHQARDTGEPHMIATLIQHILATHPADPSRVYIAGLSAGGAMAALMAGLYPELIAAVGVHSGLPAGAANDVVSAFSAMRRGARPSGTAGGTAEGDADGGAVVMPTIVFHGSADKTVNPDNGDQIIDAALAALGSAGITLQKVEQLADSPEGRDPAGNQQRDTLRTVYSGAGGKSYVEHWAVDAGPHAWSGGDAAGSFTDPHGPSASEAMLAFFLQHQRAN